MTLHPNHARDTMWHRAACTTSWTRRSGTMWGRQA
jgi:hypothetical protein